MADSTLSILVKFAALDRLTQPLRTMSGASKAASRDLAAARKDVLALEKQAAQIGGFKDQQAAIAKTHAELDTARKRVAALRAAIQQADGPTGRLTRSLEAATGKVARLDDGLQKQVTRLGSLRTGLTGAGVDVTRLADAERKLEAATAAATRKLEEQQAKVRRSQEIAAKVDRAQTRGANLRAGGVRAIGVGAVAGQASISIAGEARDFQSILVDIALKADLGTAATRRMGRELLNIAPKVGQLPANLAAGIDTLAGLGLDARLAQRVIQPIALAATAYKAEITDLSNATYSSIDNLKVPFEQTARALDIMAAAGKAGAFEIKDMASYFPALTAAASGLGQTGVAAVADLAAAAQIARKGAGDSSTAANNLLNVLNKINATETIKNFSKVGIDLPKALKKAYADGKTPLEAIIELTRKATGGDLSNLSKFFGDAQAQAALRPLIQNTDLYRKIRAEALKANGTVEADFNNRVANDGAAKLASYNAQIERLKIVAGAQLLPALNKVLEIGGTLADRFSVWADANPALAQGLLVTVAALGGLLLVGGGLFVVLGSIISGVSAVAGAFAVGFLPAIAIVAGIVAAVALLGYAAYKIYENWGPISAWFSGLWNTILGVFNQIGADLAVAWDNGLIGIIALIIKWGGTLLSTIWSALSTAFIGAFNFLTTTLPQAWEAVTIVLKSLIWKGLSALGNLFYDFGANTIKGLMRGINGQLPFLDSTMKKVTDKTKNVPKQQLKIKSPSRVFMEIGDQMMAGLRLGVDRGVDDPLQRLRRAGAQLAGVTALAIAPTAALAVQPVNPLGGGVSSAGRAAGSASAAGQGSVHHHTYQITVAGGPGVDMRAQARELMEEIRRLQASERISSYQDDA